MARIAAASNEKPPRFFSRLRARWANVSLKTSFVVYMVLYLVIALAGSLASSIGLVYLHDSYSVSQIDGLYLYDPQTNELCQAREVSVGSQANGTARTLYIEDARNEYARIPLEALPGDVRIDPIGTYYLFSFSAYDETPVFNLSNGQYLELDPNEITLTPKNLASYDEYARSQVAYRTQLQEESHAEPAATAQDTAAELSEEPLVEAAAVVSATGDGSFAAEFGTPAQSTAEGSDLTAEALLEGLTFSSVGYFVVDPLPTSMRVTSTSLMVLAVLMFPLWFGICIWIASRRFFARRIKPALTVLDDAATKIAEQDLDFVVTYPRFDEMGHLAASFETMRASLAQTQRVMWRTAEERKRLNAAFAHDLRTPLTVLRGKVELLQAHAETGSVDPMRVAADCQALSQQVDRLERYVAAMASVQRLEDRTPAPAPERLGDLARDIATAGEALCDQKGVTFSVVSSSLTASVLQIDRSFLLEVAENLIANAARHATATVHATIELTSSASHGSAAKPMLKIIVEDDGPGFSASALRHACSPFYSENGTGGSFGLGLNIAQTLCEKHGGGLGLANRPNGGARATAWFAC